MFTGFPEETLRFFLDIRFHNNSTYFDEHRERYRMDVQTPFYAFIEALGPAMQKIDPLMEIRPHKCLARIRRDTRFTKDKSPYRDHLWLCFRRAAEPREGSVNFFFELSPSDVSWGFGTWGENKPMMEVLRRRIEADPEGVGGIIRSAGLPEHHLMCWNDTYKRMAVPPGVPEWLRPWYAARSIYVGRADTKMEWAHTEQLVRRVLKDYKAMEPLYRLLRGICDTITT